MNHQITFDPNGGDLGRAEMHPVSPPEFLVVVPHIAYIFECLYAKGLSRLPFKYAFEFPIHVRNQVSLAINTLQLPPHVAFYECEGQKLFEMRGNSGGIASGVICYLITKD